METRITEAVLYGVLGDDVFLDTVLGKSSQSCKFCSQKATHQTHYNTDGGQGIVRHCGSHKKMAAQLIAKGGHRATETVPIQGIKALHAPSADPRARELLEYWVHGEGAAKIGWGKGGDFHRCVKHLRKYVGTRAEGLCNVYHGAALGAAPGQGHGKSAVLQRAMELGATLQIKVNAARTDENDERTAGGSRTPAGAPSGHPTQRRRAAAKKTTTPRKPTGSESSGSGEFNSKHPRNPDGTFKYKNDTGEGAAKRGTKDPRAADGKVTGRISAAQQILVRAGVLDKKAGRNGNAIDGMLGPKTEAALKKYQEKNGLKATGQLDPATMAKMGISKDGKPVKKAAAKKTVAKPQSGKKYDDIEFDTKDDGGEPAMGLEYKCVGVSGFKDLSADQEGLVETIVSVTGLRDNVNDVITPGVYAKSLAVRTPKGVWSHTWAEPVSKTVDIKELMPGDQELPDTLPNGDPWPADAGALKVLTLFNLATQRGREAYADVKFFGAEQEWSIGYNVPAGGATVDTKTGIRTINAIELFEYSPVLFGAMPSARTQSVKDAQMSWKMLNATDLETGLTEVKSLLDSLEEKAKRSEDEEDPDESMMDEDMEETGDEEDQGLEEEDVEDEEPKAKRGNKALSSAQAAKIQTAIDALAALLNDSGESAPSEETQQEKTRRPRNVSTKSLGELVAAAFDNDAELVESAEAFDAAVKAGNIPDMEAAATPILDEIEAQLEEDGDDGDNPFTDVTDAIVAAIEKVEQDSGGKDKTDADPADDAGDSGEESAAKVDGKPIETKTLSMDEWTKFLADVG